MTSLTVNGRQVTVSDDFLKLPPDQQQATVDEIAKSLPASQPAAQTSPSWGDYAQDMAISGASGVRTGIEGLAGLPGTIREGTRSLAAKAAQYFGASPETASIIGDVASFNPFTYFSPSAADLHQGTGTVIPDYTPQTTPGKYSEKVGEMLPGALALGGGTLASAIRYGVLPGLANEAAGQATEGSPIEPYARVAASLVAPMVPSTIAKVISPFAGSISPARQAASDYLVSQGVRAPTAGQLTGSKGLQFAESELGGGATKNILDDQARTYTEAATNFAGQQGVADQTNNLANSQRLSTGFRDISARNSVVADPQMDAKITSVLQDYKKVLPTAQKEIVQNFADDISTIASSNGGSIPGDVYQATRARLGRMANSAKNTDPEYSGALKGIRNALDDAMERSVSPEDAAEWARLRKEYGNSKVIEKSSVGGGEDSGQGLISPARLRTAIVQNGGKSAYARGLGDMDRLASSGQTVLTPMPNSGTAARTAVRVIPAAVGGALGGAATGDVINGLMAAGAASAAPMIAGRALMSGPVQAYLTNQLAPTMSTVDPRTLAVIQSLISNDKTRR